MKLKAFDIFSGCGGLSRGLHDAGFDVLGGVEILPHARETYFLNHPGSVLFSDVRNIQSKDLLDQLQIERGELDLLAGCPPCQGFSTMRTKNRAAPAEDERNELIFDFIRMVDFLLPKTVMVENVPGLLKDWRLAKAKQHLKDLGYYCKAGVLDAQKFGVPQRRKRMILMASRFGEIELPEGNEQQSKTVKQTIGNLTPPEKSKVYLQQYRKKHTQVVKDRIKRIPKDGGSRSALGDDQLACHKRINGFKDVYGRMAWDKVAPTITRFCNNPSKGRFLHPEQDRAITLLEAALLQTFPKKYKFSSTLNDSQIAGMIGEALPPLFAKKQALHIKKHIIQTTVSQNNNIDKTKRCKNISQITGDG
ncbi:MAG: DNA cytosine methyltransferase [Leptospirales bacterium]